jgi:hypothetical protein
MKKTTITSLCIILFSLFNATISAQNVGYTYSLVQNDNYNYTIGIVPDASNSNFVPLVQGYGFIIFVPIGTTITITDSFKDTANKTFFPGSAVGIPDKNGYLITENLSAQTPLSSAPSAGLFIPMVTIDIVGEPTSGLLEILANDSALTQSSSQFKSFLTADAIDDNQFLFTDLITTTASGLSGDSSFDFATLSSEEFDISKFMIYPNPVNDSFNIELANITVDSVKIFNINGTLVKTINPNTLENAIDISELQTGLYFLQLSSESSKHTIKLVKQ